MNLKHEPIYTITAQTHMPTTADCVYADDEFIVERHFLPPHAMFEYRLVVKRRDGKTIGDWRTLQDAKNQVMGEEREAIQVFPPESEVTDTANHYHLWVVRPDRRFPVRLEAAAEPV